MSTLGTLVDNVRINLGETTARFYTDSEIKYQIGNAYKKYFNDISMAGAGWFQTKTTLALVNGDEEIDLDALNPTFKEIGKLSRNTSLGIIPMLDKRKRFQASYTTSTGTGDAYVPDYYIRGRHIILDPKPVASEAASDTTGLTLEYVYIPTFPTSSSNNVFEFDSNFTEDFEPMIELKATIGCLETKDGMGGVSDIQSFRGRLQELEAVFQEAITPDEQPDRIDYIGLNYPNYYTYW